MKIPDTLPQLVPLQQRGQDARAAAKPTAQGADFRLAGAAGCRQPGALFPGMEIIEAHPFHVTRDADSAIQDLEAGDLLESVEEGVWQRRFADVVRVEVDEDMPAPILEILTKNMELEPRRRLKISGGPLSLVRVRSLTKLDRPDLKFPPFVPAMPPALAEGWRKKTSSPRSAAAISCCSIRSNRFSRWSALLQKAARDPDVLAIKITLYRVGRNAPVVDALLEAMENGKQVAVLLELKARFDEESNIEWARKLEEYGVHVVYGLMGLKVHCKVAADGAQGGRCHPPLRASFHRQLQRRDRAALYRHRHAHLRSRHRRGLHRPVQLPDRLLGEESVPQAAGRASHSARPRIAASDRARDRAPEEPAAAGT